MKQINYRYKTFESDIKNIREIVESTGFFYNHEIDVAEELIYENISKGEDESGYSFVFIEEDEKIVGFSCYGEIPCTKKRYDLYWIVIHNDYRNSGYGTLLISETEKKIKEKDGKIVYIETSSKSMYQPTIKFYIKNGYKIDAEIKNFYDENDNKIIFSKQII